MNPLQNQIDDLTKKLVETHDPEEIAVIYSQLKELYRLCPECNEN